MAKRKAKRTAKRKAKRNREESAARCEARLQAAGMYSLPDHLIEEILLWNRPKDANQWSIWRWVCRMSATCAAFRRVICSTKPGVPPLTPSILNLDHAGFSDQEEALKLMNTIRQSEWMGTNIQSLKCVGFASGENYDAAVDAFVSLLTTFGTLPNLSSVSLSRSRVRRRLPLLPDRKSFLPDLVREHPGLTTLRLANDVLGNRSQDYLAPHVFTRLASSLPNLDRFEISAVQWLESKHLLAFFSNVGSKLTNLCIAARTKASSDAFNGQVFASIATHCHNLVTLQVSNLSIPSRQFKSILQSNDNLLCVDVFASQCDNPRLFFDSIAEYSPQLEKFDGRFCDWVDDDGIMRIFNSQINAFGRILFKKLHIGDTGVSVHGLRSVLTRWREVSHALPFKVYYSWLHLEDAQEEPINILSHEFPEVWILG